jgi:aerobic-type carbon monoxide dehydrogenase small subunit (CoxS/CutS family)
MTMLKHKTRQNIQSHQHQQQMAINSTTTYLVEGEAVTASISVIMSLGHSSVTFIEEYVTL